MLGLGIGRFLGLVKPTAGPPAQSARPRQSAIPILPRSLFDADAYLARNPDVAQAVRAGHTTAYGHYAMHGFLEEGRGERPQSYPTASASLGMRNHPVEALVDRVIDLELEKRALLDAWDRQLSKVNDVTFDMLSEDVEDEAAPPLDRRDVDESKLDEDQLHWRRNGFLIKPNFMPQDRIDRYCEIRSRVPSPHGWDSPTPHMQIAELRDVGIYPPLMKLMEKLIGEEMGLHLDLTGWVSTERNWHQDDYLNPPYINSWYAAVWMALDDIHPDCGPFEFVPGSHKWPVMRSHKVRLYLTPEERQDDNWPRLAERVVDDIAEREIQRSGIQPQKFIAKKGDLLIWHGRLMHRGSFPNQPGMLRKSLICHYSGLSHRVDMPIVERTPEGSAYFRVGGPIDFDPYTAEEKAAAA